MRRGMRGPERMTTLDPVVLEGPPVPAEFARIVDTRRFIAMFLTRLCHGA